MEVSIQQTKAESSKTLTYSTFLDLDIDALSNESLIMSEPSYTVFHAGQWLDAEPYVGDISVGSLIRKGNTCSSKKEGAAGCSPT